MIRLSDEFKSSIFVSELNDFEKTIQLSLFFPL